MSQRETLVGYLQDALAHLYERPHLDGHALGPIVFGTKASVSGDKLRRLLLDAIERLRPAPSCPPGAPAWRSYRFLVLRYVEGVKRQRIAAELQMSVRQSQREHRRALAELAAVLYQDRSGTDEPRPDGFQAETAGARAEAAPSGGDADLLRIGGTPPGDPVDIADTLRDAVGIVERLAEMRGAQVRVQIETPLPRIPINRLVLRQVVIDLVTCALDSAPRAAVRLLAADSPQGVRVEVTAVGEPGGRREPPDTAARLSASATLIALQGGALVNAPREGLAFHAVARLPRPRTNTLLVVDDNPDVAYMFARFLEGAAYRVLHASTGAAALQIARQAAPDAITLDVLMPSQDGWDTLRQLVGDPATSDVPIIMCSVLPERSLALSLGVREFLDKPVRREALLDALGRAVPPAGAPRR
jgi:CheY-like chemotaxis protein